MQLIYLFNKSFLIPTNQKGNVLQEQITLKRNTK